MPNARIAALLWGAVLLGGCSSAMTPTSPGDAGRDRIDAGGGGGTGGMQASTGGQPAATGGAPASGGEGGIVGDATGGASASGGAGGAGTGGGGRGGMVTGGAGPGGGGSAAAGRGGTAGSATGGRGAAGGGAAGAGGAGGARPVYSPCPALPAPCKILPFGDSITFGVGSNGSGSNGGYRVELFHRAHLDGKAITFVGTSTANGPTTVDGVTFPRQNEGHSGFTIDNKPATATLAARSGISPLVATVMPATKPDIVTLMIGTNDVQLDNDLVNAPRRLGNLLDSIIAADAHTLVVVAQIVPTTDAGLNTAVQTFNAAIPALVNARASAGKHIVLVDLYQAIASDPTFQTTGRIVPDPTVGPMFDWLHPNVSGYKRIGDTWYEGLKGALR